MYGQLPKQLGTYSVECKEMLFYQYLPIKLIGYTEPVYEERLECYDHLVGAICCDFIGAYGLDRYVNSYVYLTAKFLYQAHGCSFNRPGWHSDGFLTDDINYIWYDKDPTIFNRSLFILSMDDEVSIKEMARQAAPGNNIEYPINSLLRLDQFNIHRVGIPTSGMRNFLKISFSKDKYDLIGNSHNYLLNYDWEMKPRKEQRNMPQTDIKTL
jgi:hypothetical protein